MLFTTLRSQEQAYPSKKWKDRLRSIPQMLLEDLYETTQNQILFIPILLALGIGIYFSLPNEPDTTTTLVLYAIITTCLFRIKSKLQHSALYIALALWLSFTGFTTSKIRTAYIDTPQIKKDIRYIELQGQIELIERLSENDGIRLTLKNISFPEKIAGLEVNKVRLRVRKATPDQYRTGDIVSGLASLKQPPGPVSYGAFNYRRQLYFERMSAVGFFYNPPEVTSSQPKASKINAIRDTINLKIANNIHISEQAAGVMNALVTGIRSGISEKLQENIRAAGLAHLLAISGLHVGMITAASFFAIRLLLSLWPSFSLKYSTKKTAAVGSLIIAFIYVLIAGSGVPALRAFLTSALIVYAIAIDRNPFSLRLVAIVASILLLFTPEILLGASFQMSFAAVVALIYFYEITKNFWIKQYGKGSNLSKIKSYILALSATSIVASLATAPMAIYHFQHLANYSLLSNMLAVPLMGIIVMPSLLLSVLLMPLGLDGLTLPIAAWGTDRIIDIANYTTTIKYAHITMPPIPLTGYVSLIFMALTVIICKKSLKLLAVFPLAIAAINLQNQKETIGFVSSQADQFLICPTENNCFAKNKVSNRYLLERWSEQLNIPYKSIQTLPKGTHNEHIKCDEFACRITIKEQKISVILEQSAITDDCQWADHIWSLPPVSYKHCKKAIVTDRFDLWRNGNHSFHLKNNAIEIKTTKDYIMNRPWS